MKAIVLRGLTRHYGEVRAVDDVSFEVAPGEIFGFMGHNGAGKTTTLRMLLGLTRPTAGSASVAGRDVVADSLGVRRVTGFLPASYALPPEMTPRSFLVYVGALFGLGLGEARARADRLLETFDLTSVAERKLGTFSTGMTQKVGLAQALVGEPSVLLLDEPTAGLDPLGRHELLELLRGLARDRGVTVLFSSHILTDVEALCRSVAILHRGRLVASGDLAALKAAEGVDSTDALYLALARRSEAS
jgi:ABC-2 type transport system ATP-binding protein